VTRARSNARFVNGKASRHRSHLSLVNRNDFPLGSCVRPIAYAAGQRPRCGQEISRESATERPAEERSKKGLKFGNWLGLAARLPHRLLWSLRACGGPRCLFRRRSILRWRSAPGGLRGQQLRCNPPDRPAAQPEWPAWLLLVLLSPVIDPPFAASFGSWINQGCRAAAALLLENGPRRGAQAWRRCFTAIRTRLDLEAGCSSCCRAALRATAALATAWVGGLKAAAGLAGNARRWPESSSCSCGGEPVWPCSPRAIPMCCAAGSVVLSAPLRRCSISAALPQQLDGGVRSSSCCRGSALSIGLMLLGVKLVWPMPCCRSCFTSIPQRRAHLGAAVVSDLRALLDAPWIGPGCAGGSNIVIQHLGAT